MFGFKRHLMVVLVVSALTLGTLSPAALADEWTEREKPTGGQMMWDSLALRPIGMVATAMGSVVWLVSYPFAYWGGNTEESTQALVKDPVEWTFRRPLGEF
jgi:hypothetical protein